MICIGIDPGKKGAYAVISNYAVIVRPWENEQFIHDMVEYTDGMMQKVVAAVEKVGAMPGQGVTGMFNFGKSAGYIEGVLSALGIPYQLIPPATWKKEFSLIGKDKAASVEVCKHLFPTVSLFPTERSRKESDGMSDALLLAEYARRKM